jgi:DNA-binding transcriptional LysR family regulator
MTFAAALIEYEIFVRSVDGGSLSDAGRALGLGPAAANAAMRRLEDRLGVRLVVRSPRNLRLTPEGERFYGYCRQALQALDEGARSVQPSEGELRGQLRISAPTDFGRNVLRPWLDAFAERHPNVAVRLLLGDDSGEQRREPIDLALRYDEPGDAMLVVQRLSDSMRVLCASPEYLARHGAPAHPLELVGRECLCVMVERDLHDTWSFRRGDERLAVSVMGRHQANDGEVVRLWAREGHGIAYLPRLDVAGDLAAGRLVPLLTDWQTEAASLSLVHGHGQLLSPLQRTLADYLRERVREYAAAGECWGAAAIPMS